VVSGTFSAAIHWSGAALVGGAVALGLAVVLVARQPVIGQALSPDVAGLLLIAAALLLLSLPAMYAAQAEAAGTLGLVAHALLTVGLLFLVVIAAPPLLRPSLNAPPGEHPLLFVLGIALTLGLLLTGIATFQADVFPRPAALSVLGATAVFFFAFFIAEFLPPAAGQISSAMFGVMLALGFGWMGAVLWLRNAP